MLGKEIVTENAEESEEDNIEDYLAQLQNSIRNITVEDSDAASSQKSQVIDTAASKDVGETQGSPERVSRERIRRRGKPNSWVVKKEKDDLEAESENRNPMRTAQARLARLERWQFLTIGNRRMRLRQRLLKKAIRDQEREIERLEKEGETAGRLKKQRRKTSAAKPVGDVGHITKRKI